LFKLLVQGKFGFLTWPDAFLKEAEEVLTDPCRAFVVHIVQDEATTPIEL
jgi:hypothetical protein